jgi:hypothetical protein
MKACRLFRRLLLLAIVIPFLAGSRVPAASRGIQFIGFTNLSEFEKSGHSGGMTFTSREIRTSCTWDELIASWNAVVPSNAWLRIEARGFHGEKPTRFYNMGLWSGNSNERRSARNEKDSDGEVSTDTLALKQTSDLVQLRLIVGGERGSAVQIKFAGLCLTDTKSTNAPLEPNRAAWGKTLEVPERSQMSYPNGGVLCSPTTVSMIMTWWSKELKRPELDQDVPDIVNEVYDANWHGTGNWTFNMAFAGAYDGMRAYVTRMSDVSELEDWIAAGLPVGLSVCYDRLRGKGPGPNGHLVVCVGFTPDGDVIINDPGTSRNVRKIFLRKNLIHAWANSKNAVYLIYPENSKVPEDRFGDWFGVD